MSYRQGHVQKWRRATKQKMIDAFGGKCGICGYSRCQDSLAFHHLDPEEKEFSMGSVMANPISWDKIVPELRKCICVCGNCHGEIHHGVTKIPDNVQRFNEAFAELKKEPEKTEPCPICQKQKPLSIVTCSRECAAKKSYKVAWDSINLEEEIKIKSMIQIATELGCSDAAVRKRLKKLHHIPK